MWDRRGAEVQRVVVLLVEFYCANHNQDSTPRPKQKRQIIQAVTLPPSPFPPSHAPETQGLNKSEAVQIKGVNLCLFTVSTSRFVTLGVHEAAGEATTPVLSTVYTGRK
ncbi:hypothetical protein E2C01_087606 [Portunus trituberculatus]|uniref:Uncharacterized protein n=1 Tax=Portunus trituberculatus TaxID=210409 RepID=A0A5B7JJS4_PORTR|nr:hypothetical protein [Portunus trituberculatus]